MASCDQKKNSPLHTVCHQLWSVILFLMSSHCILLSTVAKFKLPCSYFPTTSDTLFGVLTSVQPDQLIRQQQSYVVTQTQRWGLDQETDSWSGTLFIVALNALSAYFCSLLQATNSLHCQTIVRTDSRTEP